MYVAYISRVSSLHHLDNMHTNGAGSATGVATACAMARASEAVKATVKRIELVFAKCAEGSILLDCPANPYRALYLIIRSHAISSDLLDTPP